MFRKLLLVVAGLIILPALVLTLGSTAPSSDDAGRRLSGGAAAEHTAESDSATPEAGAASPGINLRVSVSNMTDVPARGKTEVWLRGEGSWFPDLQYGGDVTTFEDRRLGTTDSLFFYPLGRGGSEMMVPIEIDSELCPQGCPRDMVNFEVWEERFVAWGSPIEGHEVELQR